MTFTIDVDNNITVLDSPQKIEERHEQRFAESCYLMLASHVGRRVWHHGEPRT